MDSLSRLGSETLLEGSRADPGQEANHAFQVGQESSGPTLKVPMREELLETTNKHRVFAARAYLAIVF